MPEFDLIRRLQEIVSPPGTETRDVRVGIGDDAAVLEVLPGRRLVLCVDTLVEAVHFPQGTAPRALGHKALAVNLSDLAAMGADPAWFLLAMTLPADDDAWLDDFARGMAVLAAETGIALVGGDTTRGKLTVMVTAAGLVEEDGWLERNGARPGDRIVVSGVPGRAANALAALARNCEPDSGDRAALEYPMPRLALGRALRGIATACIDVSDGLAGDLGHILDQSGVGATLDLGSLPLAESLAGLADEQRWQLQLSGGDDYELCFTLPAARTDELPEIARSADVALTVIGEVREGGGLGLVRPDGAEFVLESAGYEHFGAGEGAGERT
jgi:thiamine-monophosphate kinase